MTDKKIPYEKIWKIIRSQGARVHFIGAFGVSMRSLIKLTVGYNVAVSASDRTEDKACFAELKSLGVDIHIGHDATLVDGASLVVYSHAIHEDNPELARTRELAIPAVTRADYLGLLMKDYSNRIGVSGTHGKSTTTAMLDAIFTAAKTRPTVLSGSELPHGDTMREGERGVMIYEACEYKDSFLRFSPSIAIALNLELDHTDYFKDIFELRESFRRAMSHASSFALVNYDDENLNKIIPEIKTKVVTFGQRVLADYRYVITSFLPIGYEFDILKHGNKLDSFVLNAPGIYNVTNATAAIVTAIEFGIDIETIKRAVASFSGIPRRLEYIGDYHQRPVYYDYAHHPTEIAAVINAVRILTHESVTVVFKPHTYSRTKGLWEEFKHAFMLADHVILNDIYPAREAPIADITSERLAMEIGDTAIYCSDAECEYHVYNDTSGAIIIMGAGDMEYIRRVLIEH
ncbi:MAG: UDP-N-acetylmuramate--L-alanine ligase [Clostridia bacterium]|nr:UDP-N-acetylmuramate--L-alanine ligase [Clostridia bacterium]